MHVCLDFRLLSNANDVPAMQPPHFSPKYPLRPEQLKSLSWMIAQESKKVQPFVEEEIVEATILQLGYRAEGKATRPVVVRGGVLADQVGYGKTTTTLALIDSQRARDTGNAMKSVKGAIPVKATLILVPPQLTLQWANEIKKFLGMANLKVVIMKNIGDIRKCMIKQIQDADIVIVNYKSCEGENYLFDVAQFAGMVELHPSSSARATAAWYKQALVEIAEHVEVLQKNGAQLGGIVSQKLEADIKLAGSAEVPVPSKRVTGQAYQKAKKKHQVKDSDDCETIRKRKRADERPVKIKIVKLKQRTDPFGLKSLENGAAWTSMKCPLFEMFLFSRVCH
jgi:hypothetical protein